jgi:hypothetical protein
VSTEITVQRAPAVWRDRFRAYELVIDGVAIGRIRANEEATFSVEPGSHRVWMKIDWCRSDILDVTIAEGQRAKLICKPNGSPLFLMLYVTLLRSRYIDLRPQP